MLRPKIDLNDDRSLKDIFEDIKKAHAEWEKRGSEKIDCDLCEGAIRCWFHRSGKDNFESSTTKFDTRWN